MPRVGNRGETHAFYDGEFWYVYSERKADIRRFEKWWGKPTRRGREDACAHWEGLLADALAIRRRRRGGGKGFQKCRVDGSSGREGAHRGPSSLSG